MIGDIDSEKSSCFKPEDREKIFDDVIKTSVGFHGINSMVFDQMIYWVVEVARDAVNHSS